MRLAVLGLGVDAGGDVPAGCAVAKEDGDDDDDGGEEVVLEGEALIGVAEHLGHGAGADGDRRGARDRGGGVGLWVWAAARREQDVGVAGDVGVADDRGCRAVVGGDGDAVHDVVVDGERPKGAAGVVLAVLGQGLARAFDDAAEGGGDKNDGHGGSAVLPAVRK